MKMEWCSEVCELSGENQQGSPANDTIDGDITVATQVNNKIRETIITMQIIYFM